MPDDDSFAAYDDLRRRCPPETAVWVDDEAWVEADLPRRPWVAPGFALRGAVTVVAGPPSTLKSSLMLCWAVAVALGRPHGRFRPTAPSGVFVYNVEDDRIEQRRRLSAVLRQFDAVPQDIAHQVVRVGPSGIGTLFELGEDGGIIPTAAMTRLRGLIEERRPAMLVTDPLAELHTADENANTALRTVIAAFRGLAADLDIAVVLVHHTRKGAVTPGDPDSARGASAIIGAARIALTLVTMPEEDAELLGLSTSRQARSNFVRLDDAKQNYHAIGDAQWYEKMLYTLDNNEIVPAAVPWEPPDLWRGITDFVANAILDDIEAGLDGGKQFYSDHPRATDRAAADVVRQHHPELNEAQAREVIKTWLKNGVLRRDAYHDETARKDRKGLRVNSAKRPGSCAP